MLITPGCFFIMDYMDATMQYLSCIFYFDCELVLDKLYLS